jgi:hypothetical protein
VIDDLSMRYCACMPAEMVEESTSQLEVQIYNAHWPQDKYVRRTVTAKELLELAQDPDAAWDLLTQLAADPNLTLDEWDGGWLYVYWAGPALADAVAGMEAPA